MEAFLETLAREAGRILLEHRGGPLQAVEKPDAGFVTEADVRSEEFLLRSILQRFPDSTVVAEESGRRAGRGRLAWYVDPLDGTTNFAHGQLGFAVSLAVVAEGVLEWGVVFAPATGELFAAQRGAGATLNGRPLRLPPARQPRTAVLATGDEYERGPVLDRSLERLRRLYARARVVRIPGSVALGLADVAAGRLDGFWLDRFNSWDIAAGMLVVREAGGVVQTADGANVRVDHSSVLVAGALPTVRWMQEELR